MEDIQTIPLSLLRPPRILLRPVNTQSVEFLEMRDSIRDGGLLNSIAVRPSALEPGAYEIVDGMYRFTCCKLLGRESMPCIVTEMTDEEVLAAQIQANAIRPETKPVEFARQLKRLQKAFPDIPMSEMCRMVGKSASWIKNQLSLLNLLKVARNHVDRDEMPLMNAYMLAKIPLSIQKHYVEQALTLPPNEFSAVARKVIQGVMVAVRTGRLEFWFNDNEFEAQPFLRPLKQVLAEINNREAAACVLSTLKAHTALDGWVAALQWACNLDPESVEKQRKAAELRQRKQNLERTNYVTDIDFEVPDL